MIRGHTIAALGLIALVLAAAAGKSSPGTNPSRPRPRPEPEPEPEPSGAEPYWIGPGWFYCFVDWDSDGAAYLEFWRRNRGHFEPRRVLAYPGGRYMVIVFEVPAEPIAWTLRGLPSPAPRGFDTAWTDLESGPVPEDSRAWVDWLENMARQATDSLREYDRRLQQWLDGLRGWR